MSARSRVATCSAVKVSYLIAVKNKANTIASCLESILKQKPDEVVVIDGWSTDGTWELVKKCKVICERDTGAGLASARNIGLSRCTGDYIVVIDGDQWVERDFDMKLKVALESNPCDAVFCVDKWVGCSIWAKAQQRLWEISSTFRPARVKRPRVFRRSILSSVGCYSENFHSLEDTDLHQKLRKKSAHFCHSKIILFSDATHISVLSQYMRGVWYGSSLRKYFISHRCDYEHITSIAPLGFFTDFFMAFAILATTRRVKVALASLVLRFSWSIGWLVGVLRSL